MSSQVKIASLATLQEVISNLCLDDVSDHPSSGPTIQRLIAMMPLFAWPDSKIMRGDAEGLFDLKELVRRANIRTTIHEDLAWDPIRQYLAHCQGVCRLDLGSDGGVNEIFIVESANKHAALQGFGYITMISHTTRSA